MSVKTRFYLIELPGEEENKFAVVHETRCFNIDKDGRCASFKHDGKNISGLIVGKGTKKSCSSTLKGEVTITIEQESMF